MNLVMLLCMAVQTCQGQVCELQEKFIHTVQEDDPNAAMDQAEYLAAQQALEKAQGTL